MISLRSKVTQRVLRYLYLHKTESFYINELAKKLSCDPGNMDRKLKELEAIGLLASEFQGNQRYYRLRRESPLYEAYDLLVKKTCGIEKMIEAVVGRHSDVIETYLFGSYVMNTMDAVSDIDVLIIGDGPIPPVQKDISRVSTDINREINVIYMTSKEYTTKKKNNDSFLKTIFSKKTIRVK